MINNKIKLILKILITLFLFYFLFKKIDSKNFFTIIKHINIYYFFITLLIFLIMQILHTIRWQILLRSKNIKNIQFLKLLKYHFIGLFFQTFLPSAIGGDFVKAYKLSKDSSQKMEAYSSVIFARLLGLIVFFAAGIIILILNINLFFSFPQHIQLIIISIYTALFIGILLIFSKKIYLLFHDLLNFKLWKKFWTKAIEFQNSLNEYKNRKNAIIISFFITFFIYLGMVYSNMTIFKTINKNIPISAFYIYTPLIYIITLIPITLNGSGIREYSLYLFLYDFSITKEQILSYSIILYGGVIIVSLFGGIFYLIDILSNKKGVNK